MADKLNKLGKTLTDLGTDFKLMSNAFDEIARDVKNQSDDLAYMKQYFMDKIQDIHFMNGWDIPTGNTPPSSIHGNTPPHGPYAPGNSQAQSVDHSRRHSFEVGDMNQLRQQPNPIENARDGGNTVLQTNTAGNQDALLDNLGNDTDFRVSLFVLFIVSL